MPYMSWRNGKMYFSYIKQRNDRVAGMQIEQLSIDELETFQDRPAVGILPGGSSIYRYGSVPAQAESSRAMRVNFTEDRLDYSEQAVDQVVLLDVVRPRSPSELLEYSGVASRIQGE